MNTKKRLFYKLIIYSSACILTCLTLFITGCTSYSKKQEALAKPIIEKYLNSISASHEIKSVEMLKARPEGYPMYATTDNSNYVYSKVLIDDVEYTVYVNTSTQEVWSNYYASLLNECLAEQLEIVCEEHGITSTISVSSVDFYYQELFEKEDEKKLEITIDSCLPINITPDNRNDSISFEDVVVTGIYIHYNAEEELPLVEVIDDYYQTYQPVAFEQLTARCVVTNDALNETCSYELMASVDSNNDASEIFWAYRTPSQDYFEKYVVYEK